MKSVTRTAPAKINLGLDVVGTRADGYHLLETVFQAVSIADTVTVSLVEQPGIALTCDHNAVPCNPKNIAWKAAQRFLEAAKITAGVQIHIAKRIPMEAGMGGGSTDGAAVLLALQELTQQALSKETLFSIAVSLGADVPFFLLGGTAYAAGIGEVLEPLPPFSAAHLVIAKGTAGVSTAAAYHWNSRLIRRCSSCGRRWNMAQVRLKLHRFAAICLKVRYIWMRSLKSGNPCWKTARIAAL